MAISEAESVNRVVTDGELERGEHPIGKLVHVSTVSHAWRGVLECVTASYFVLSPDHTYALVDSTGAIDDYVSRPEASSTGDVVAPRRSGKRATIRIPRTAIVWVMSWD